jgi:hypothetical protein
LREKRKVMRRGWFGAMNRGAEVEHRLGDPFGYIAPKTASTI